MKNLSTRFSKVWAWPLPQTSTFVRTGRRTGPDRLGYWTRLPKPVTYVVTNLIKCAAPRIKVAAKITICLRHCRRDELNSFLIMNFFIKFYKNSLLKSWWRMRRGNLFLAIFALRDTFYLFSYLHLWGLDIHINCSVPYALITE